MRIFFITFNLLMCSLLICGTAYGSGDKSDSSSSDDYLLVVPFKSQLYTATGDYFICKANEMTPGELNEMIRCSLAATLTFNLGEYYNTLELNVTQSGMNDDVQTLYKITKIKYKKKRLQAYYKAYPPFKITEMLGPRRVRWGSDCVNNNSVKPNQKRHQYAEAHITNDTLYRDICKRNKAAYVLIVTQFEMYTRFSTCLDLQRNIFQRDFYVHYTLLTNEGEIVDGGVVATTYESSSNDVKKILNDNLGNLSALLVEICRKNI